MQRRVLFLLVFLALTLAACKPAGQARTATAVAGKTSVAAAGSTTAPKQTDTFNMPAQALVPGCTVKSFIPTPDPSSLFPPISSDDWYRGPLTATVKIIEYSDFQ